MKLAFTLCLLFLLTSQGLSKPVEEDIDYELQKDDYNDEYDEDESLDGNEDDNDALPIEITNENQTFTVSPHSHIDLPCNVSGNRAAVVMMWKKDDNIIFQDGHLFSTFDEKRFILANTTLRIKHLETTDSGKYKCLIIGGAGRVEVTHTLKVTDNRPQIISLTADKPTSNYTAGDKMELTCIATGEPEPKITWSMKGAHYGNGKTLLIENIDHKNTGNYQCLADFGNGQLDHKAIAIKVKHKPIVDLVKTITNIDGDKFDVILRCEVHADPPAIVVWKKNGEEIKVSRRTKNNSNNLRLTGDDEFGKYTCRADNEVGSNEDHVIVTKAPSQAVFREGHELNHGKSFNLTWEVESLFPISEYVLEYKKKSEDQWQQEKPEVTNSESGNIYTINHVLKDLEPGEYEFRVKSKNQYGWSEDSAIRTLKAHKAHHGHKNHKNHHHQSNPISHNEEDNNIALEARADGSTNTSGASFVLPSTSLLCVLILALFFRH